MAITLLTVPQLITPAYNDIQFRFSATTTEYQTQGFKYWMKLKVTDSNDTPTFAKEYNQFVTPDLNGVGLTDVSKILQAFIQPPKPINIGNGTSHWLTQNNWNNIFYQIEYGYEKYITYVFDSMAIETIATKRYVKLNNSFNDYLFVDGDQINITPSNPTDDVNIALVEGIHTIVSATTGFIIIDVVIPIGVTLPTTTGMVEFADKRKVREITATPSAWYQANNSVLPFYDVTLLDSYKGYDWRVYASAYNSLSFLPDYPYTSSAKLITSMGSGHIMNKYERPQITLQFVDCPHANFRVVTTSLDSLSSTTIDYTLPSTTNMINVSVPVYLIPGAEDKDVNIAIQIPIVEEFTTTWVTVFEPLTLKASKKCPINTYVLQFMDKMGAMSTFNFQGRAYRNGNVIKKDYNQSIGSFETTPTSTSFRSLKKFPNGVYPSKYDYDELGTRVINVNEKIELELNTLNEEWNHDQNKLWGELIASPFVYLIENGNYNNRVAVNIKTSDYNIDSTVNKRLISKKIKIEFANQNKTNI